MAAANFIADSMLERPTFEVAPDTSLPQLPLDDDPAYEVQKYIIAFLTSSANPHKIDDVAAERVAKNYHANGLEFKTASIGDLETALGTTNGMIVFQAIEHSMTTFGSITASLKKTARSYGFDIFPNRDASDSRPSSRRGSHVPSHDASRKSSVGNGTDNGGAVKDMGTNGTRAGVVSSREVTHHVMKDDEEGGSHSISLSQDEKRRSTLISGMGGLAPTHEGLRDDGSVLTHRKGSTSH